MGLAKANEVLLWGKKKGAQELLDCGFIKCVLIVLGIPSRTTHSDSYFQPDISVADNGILPLRNSGTSRARTIWLRSCCSPRRKTTYSGRLEREK